MGALVKPISGSEKPQNFLDLQGFWGFLFAFRGQIVGKN
jgi:hypothetical protein